MRSAALFALLLTSACATVERAPSIATVALPERFALLDAETRAAGTPTDLLPRSDPAFAPLLTKALADAPDLAAAVARIDIARAGTRAARAERLPNVQGAAGATGTRASDANFSNLPPGVDIDRTQAQFDIGLDASWDADIFGRLRSAERAQGARLDAATADAAAVRIALASDIALALTDYRAAEARRQVVETDLRDARDLVSITSVRTRAGITPGFDLVRAQSLEADARARLEPIASDRVAAIARLVTLTALPSDGVLGQLVAAPVPPALAPPPLAIPSLLLRRRPDVIAAERRLAAADFEIASAAAERFPRLSITGALGLVALALGDLFSADAIQGSLGAGIAGPLLDFGRIGARIDQRQAEAAEAFANYRGAIFTALGDVERSLGQITAADRRARALAERVAIDRDATGLARERYRRGLADFLTVIDAQRTLNTVREAEISARADQARRRIELYRAIGGE